MKPFPELSDEGRSRRLRELAETALAAHGLVPEDLTLIAVGQNATFRVEGRGGARYALRIGPAPGEDRLHLPTELAWLERLVKDPAVSAAVPIRNSRRRLITEVEHPGVPGRRRCVLFEWLPGSPVGDHATAVDYGMLGELAAHLHVNAAGWRRSRGLKPLVWDRVFYYPGEPVVLYDGRFRKVMTRERTKVVREVEKRAAEELRRIHSELPTMLLHGDLHPWNVHLHRGRLHVFDFEEAMRGAPVQDIAITLWHASRHSDYEKLLEAFVEGYRTVRGWPVEYAGQVNLLMAARDVMLINYALRKTSDAEAFVEGAVARMTDLLAGE